MAYMRKWVRRLVEEVSFRLSWTGLCCIFETANQFDGGTKPVAFSEVFIYQELTWMAVVESMGFAFLFSDKL
jgi:hypothetical protein